MKYYIIVSILFFTTTVYGLSVPTTFVEPEEIATTVIKEKVATKGKKLDLSFLNKKNVFTSAKWDEEFIKSIVSNYSHYTNRGTGLIKFIENVSMFHGAQPNSVSINKVNGKYLIGVIFYDIKGNVFNLPRKFTNKTLTDYVQKLSEIYGKPKIENIIHPAVNSELNKKILRKKNYQWVVGNTYIDLVSMHDDTLVLLSYSGVENRIAKTPFIDLMCTLDNDTINVKIDTYRKKLYFHDRLQFKDIEISDNYIIGKKRKEKSRRTFITTTIINRINGYFLLEIDVENVPGTSTKATGKCSINKHKKLF